MEISFKADLQKLRASLDEVSQRQIPFATVLALNEVARQAQREVNQQMSRSFNRPTPFTLTATWVRRANKTTLQAEVLLKDESFKSTPATKWLAPEVYGGVRPFKRYELALHRAGILPTGMFTVPGQGAKLDGYGNMSRGQLIQILAWFRAFAETGHHANTTDKGRQRLSKGSTARAKKYRPPTSYFAVGREGRGGRQPGIYLRRGRAHEAPVTCVLLFVKRFGYRVRLPFHETVERTAKVGFEAAFELGMARAMSTARG